MASPSELIEHLAYIVRKYPRNGGPNPVGMKLLQRGNRRVALRTVEDWPKNSTVPTEVAQVLLGIQFHNQKAVVSCFNAAEAVTRHLGLELTWREDFQLGGYLISCLVKAEYYRFYNILRSAYRFEYALMARKKEIKGYPETDSYTSDEPFPPWTSAMVGGVVTDIRC